MPGRWVRWFRQDDNEADESLEIARNRARAVLEASEAPFFAEILVWIDKEAFKALAIGAHADMIVAMTRQNTLREVRAHLLGEVEKAKRLMELTKGA